MAFIITPLASFPMSPRAHRKNDSRNSSRADTAAFSSPCSAASCGNAAACDDPHLPQATGILGDIEIPPEETSPREQAPTRTLIRGSRPAKLYHFYILYYYFFKLTIIILSNIRTHTHTQMKTPSPLLKPCGLILLSYSVHEHVKPCE